MEHPVRKVTCRKKVLLDFGIYYAYNQQGHRCALFAAY